MTPKEKAEELVNKFFTPSTQKDLITRAHAKKCALIAVDEILKYLSDSFGIIEYDDPDIEYLEEVKQEIEAL